MKKLLQNRYLFLLPGLLYMLYACNSTIASNEKETEADSSLVQPSITTVTIADAEKKDFPYFIHTNGKVRSLQEQVIAVEKGGKLIESRARTGVLFPAGSVLGRLETTAIQHRLERAQLVLFNSQKEYESQLLGYEVLLKEKTGTEAETIRQKLRISSGLSGAEQEIKEAKYELSKTVITAPFSGVLADIKGEQGEILRPGHELFRIYDPRNLLLEVMVLEADVMLLKKGTPAAVSPVSSPDARYAAELFEINPYVNENGMVQVRLKVRNPGNNSQGLLFPGMNCTAVIEIPLHKAVTIPKDAVVTRSGRTVVFTYENGKAKWNYVITGRDNGKEIEIKEGILPGMKVITTNNLQLAHDAPVQLAH